MVERGKDLVSEHLQRQSLSKGRKISNSTPTQLSSIASYRVPTIISKRSLNIILKYLFLLLNLHYVPLPMNHNYSLNQAENDEFYEQKLRSPLVMIISQPYTVTIIKFILLDFWR